MRSRVRVLAAFPLVFAGLVALHVSVLRLPYFWDEAGYYVPAALDFYRHGRLIPRLTQPVGHTPLVSVYLAAAWRLFTFSELVTRTAMLALAAATVLTTYVLGRRVAGRETGVWSALLLAISPLFFAQSSLVFADLAAACFTTLAILFILDRRPVWFMLAASLAVLSKETAVVMLPVVWIFAAWRRKEWRPSIWAALLAPVVPLIIWTFYYHSATGYWTGNSGYLQYNLYSSLTPLHICRSLLARLAEIFFQGFNWLLVGAAIAGAVWTKRRSRQRRLMESAAGSIVWSDFVFITAGLMIVYVAMLSLVGGAVLPRYMLPVFPVFFILAVHGVWRLPVAPARIACVIIAAAFVGAWFINPPYPFPYEDNLAYTDYVRLHQRAAKYLESLPGSPVILTAWPATDELRRPFLGYVNRPLRVAAVNDFEPDAFRDPPRFQVFFLYSRKWDPSHNLMTLCKPLRKDLEHLFQYEPPAAPGELKQSFHLKLLRQFHRRGQWVRIYSAPIG
ncbi:MAG: ArnT family glycosyltransferase [Terriglobia bacterium]